MIQVIQHVVVFVGFFILYLSLINIITDYYWNKDMTRFGGIVVLSIFILVAVAQVTAVMMINGGI